MLDAPFDIDFGMQLRLLRDNDVDVIFWYGLDENVNLFMLMMSVLFLLSCFLLYCSILQVSNIMLDLILPVSHLSYFTFIFIYAHLEGMKYSRLNLFFISNLSFMVLELLQMLKRLLMMWMLPWGKFSIICRFFHLHLAYI
jgi:hypothetical protein